MHGPSYTPIRRIPKRPRSQTTSNSSNQDISNPFCELALVSPNVDIINRLRDPLVVLTMAGGPQRSRPRARPRYNDQPPWYATGTRRRPPRAALSSRASSAGAAQRQRGPDGRFVPIETKECSICAETLALAEFAVSQISEQCNHPPGACLECIRSSIRFDLETKQWDQIRCLECRALMDYHHVKKYADEETFNRQVHPIDRGHFSSPPFGASFLSDICPDTRRYLFARRWATQMSLFGVELGVARARNTRREAINRL